MASPEPASAFTKLRPLSGREKTLVILAFLTIYAVGFIFWIYQPFTERIAGLRVGLKDEQTKLEAARVVLHRLEEIERRIAELTAQMQELDLLVPGDNRAPHFLYSCWTWERTTGAKVLTMDFAAPAAGQGYEEFKVNFTVAGTYAAQVDFMARLEEMDRLVRVDSVSLLPDDPFVKEEGETGGGAGEGGEGGEGGGAPSGPGSATTDIVTAAYLVHLFVDPTKAQEAAQAPPGEGLLFTLPAGRKTPFLP